MPCLGISGAALLVALAAGYLVCSLAKKEQGTMKTVGYIIGVGIIVVAGLLIVNALILTTRHCKMKGWFDKSMMPSMQQGPAGMRMKDMPMAPSSK